MTSFLMSSNTSERDWNGSNVVPFLITSVLHRSSSSGPTQFELQYWFQHIGH